MSNFRIKLSHAFASVLTLISPMLNTKVLYQRRFGKKWDLNNPQTLNDKVLWLKFHTYYNNPLITQCADKYRVRDYVKACGCEEILIELYGIYKSVDEIDFAQLPEKFVLKCIYGAKMNIICEDKSQLNVVTAKKEMHKWSTSKQHLRMSEMHYADIPRWIICEKFIETQTGHLPNDYKIYCCNGKAYYVMVCVGRENNDNPKFYYFDIDGTFQRDMTLDGQQASEDFDYALPMGWREMIRYAEILSKPFPFVRADFYLNEGRIIFGELTFTPAGGLDAARLSYTDKLLGDLIILPKE